MKNAQLQQRRDKIYPLAKLALFSFSYCPLFLIMVFKQLAEHFEYLSFGGFNKQSVILFFSKFWITVLLSVFALFGILGTRAFLYRIDKANKQSGYDYKIIKLQNKNTESIGYIATYYFPFMFQSFSSLFEIISFLVLLGVIYIVYTHSTLIIVNPLLNLWYSLYNIDYCDMRSNKIREGTFIVDFHYLEPDDIITAKKWGQNLFYARIKEIRDG